METLRCESCGLGVPRWVLLCEACAAAEGRCSACGAPGVFDPAACERCRTIARRFPSAADVKPPPAVSRPTRSQPRPQPATTALALACIAVSLAFWSGVETVRTLSRFGFVPPGEAFDGSRPWGLALLAFPHGDLLHLFFNLTWLWRLGGALERSLGVRRFLLFTFAAAWVSSGCQLLVDNPGIGFSGVVYAYGGLAWQLRRQHPELAEEMTPGAMQLLLGWGVLCIIGTVTGLANVANGAHVGGLLFGLAVGALARRPRPLPLVPLAAGTVTLVLAAGLPLYWAPWSAARHRYEGQLAADRAYQAGQRRDYDTAIRYYRQSLDLGVDPKWAWRSLAEAYGYRSQAAEYREALTKLRQLDPAAAREVEAMYGAPKLSPAGTPPRP